MFSEDSLKREGTVLFCDIRDFTALFDDIDPIEAAKFANSVLAVLGEAVETNDGWVDRFTGDGFMAHFGFIKEQPDHALRACKTGMLIRDKLKEINTDRYLNVQKVVNVGIGINTGVGALCKIKTRQLEQETVMGDVVNLASRIEGMTKYFMVDILTSESTYKIVNEHFSFRKMPQKSIKGKRKPVHTYWFLPVN